MHPCMYVNSTVLLNVFVFFRYLKEGPCYDPQFHFTYRGAVKMKGKKDPMECWFLTRKITLD